MARGGSLPPVRKGLGQHFLSDRHVLARIADALALAPDETVIEIGAGRGALTDALRDRARLTIAIEYDRKLAALLRQRYADDARVRIVEANVLEISLGSLAPEGYALVGNVPYYITTPIVFHALRRPRASRAVFLVQREVAERMASPADRSAYGALSVNLQALARVEVLFRVPAGAFTPAPKVESAVVRITPLDQPLIEAHEEAAFQGFVQQLFGMRRKQLRRSLRSVRPMSPEQADAMLASVGIAPEARPETLEPAQLVALARALG